MNWFFMLTSISRKQMLCIILTTVIFGNVCGMEKQSETFGNVTIETENEQDDIIELLTSKSTEIQPRKNIVYTQDKLALIGFETLKKKGLIPQECRYQNTTLLNSTEEKTIKNIMRDLIRNPKTKYPGLYKENHEIDHDTQNILFGIYYKHKLEQWKQKTTKEKIDCYKNKTRKIAQSPDSSYYYGALISNVSATTRQILYQTNNRYIGNCVAITAEKISDAFFDNSDQLKFFARLDKSDCAADGFHYLIVRAALELAQTDPVKKTINYFSQKTGFEGSRAQEITKNIATKIESNCFGRVFIKSAAFYFFARILSSATNIVS